MKTRREPILERYLGVHEGMRARHGYTAKALWGSEASQRARFSALVRLIHEPAAFSVVDLGCGLCDFYGYLIESGKRDFEYCGADINPKFIAESRRRFPSLALVQGSVDKVVERGQPYDYVVGSGIYNLGKAPREAESLFVRQFRRLFPLIRRGFAVNFLSTYSEHPDGVSMYHDPSALFRLCMRRFSRNVVLDHTYLPHDFTVLVYK